MKNFLNNMFYESIDPTDKKIIVKAMEDLVPKFEELKKAFGRVKDKKLVEFLKDDVTAIDTAIGNIDFAIDDGND